MVAIHATLLRKFGYEIRTGKATRICPANKLLDSIAELSVRVWLEKAKGEGLRGYGQELHYTCRKLRCAAQSCWRYSSGEDAT